DDGWKTENHKGVVVLATSHMTFLTVAATVAGGIGSLAANVTVDGVNGSTQAYIENARVRSGGDVVVRALHHTDADSGGGAAAIGAGLAAAAGVDTTLLGHRTEAWIDGSGYSSPEAMVKADEALMVEAEASVVFLSVVMGVAVDIAPGAALAGSASAVNVSMETRATVRQASIEGRTIDVRAENHVEGRYIVGALAGSGGFGAGASLAVGLLNPRAVTSIQGATLTASNDIRIAARQTLDMGISVVAGAVGGGALSGAFSVMMADAHTEARVVTYGGQRSELRSTGGSVEVLANTLTKMNVRENAGDYLQGVGAVSVGGVGAGASVEVMVLRERTLASIDDYSLVHAAGDIRVEALLERDINSAALAFTASGTLSLNGAISVISLGAGLSEDAVADVEELGQLVSGSFAGFANGDYAMQESASSGDSGIEDDEDDPYDPEDFERDFDAPANAGNQNQANRKTTNQALDELTFQVSFDVEKNGQVIGDTTAKVGRFTELDAGGDIVVEAKELLEVGIVTGGAAISGAASVGISIAVLELNGAVSATVGYGSSLAADGQIRVASHAELHSNLHAVGGAAALGIAIGGQSTIILDRSIQQAYIEDAGTPAQAVVINTPGNLTLSASVDRQHQALAAGGSIGKVAAGISVGVVEISGATQAWLGERAILGDDTLLNNVMVSATSLDRVNLTVVAVAAGLAGAGTANVSTVSLSNDVQAWLGSGIT
ncbi:MAG: hypothetical protein ACRC3F_10020, partial [Billgrantia desiderata]